MNLGRPESGGRFLALDSLRGLLACLIVVFHLPSDGWLWTFGVVRNGFLAVTFFFVLSGFVIGNTYGERIADGFSIPRFLGLRLGRIYPLHLFMIGVIGVYAAMRLAFGWGAVREGLPFTGLTAPQELPYNLLLLQKFASELSWNTPSWSIGVEWWTYAVFALLAALFGARWRLFPTATALIAPGAFLLVTHQKIGSGLTETFGCMLSFGFGLIICEFRREARVRAIGDRLSFSLATVFEVAAVLLGVWMMANFGGRLSPLITPVLTVVVAVFSFERGAISRLLIARPMLVLGELSYSIYMVHHFVLDRLLDAVHLWGRSVHLPLSATEAGRTVLVGSAAACDLLTIALLAIVVVVSRLTYRFVEVPARLWSRSVVNPRAIPRDPPAAF